MPDMFVLLFVIAFLIFVGVVLLWMKHDHNPLSKLENEKGLKEELKKYGIVHYTTRKSIEPIKKSGEIIPGDDLINSPRALMFKNEAHIVWCYSRKNYRKKKSENSDYKYLQKKKVDIAILINVDDELLQRLTYREKDKAIACHGSIIIDKSATFEELE